MPQIKDMSTADIERYLAARKELEAIERGTSAKAKPAKAAKAPAEATTKSKHKMTKAGRDKLAAAARERWKKVKKAGKNRL